MEKSTNFMHLFSTKVSLNLACFNFFFPFYIYLGGKTSNEACRHLPLETDIISAQLQNTLSFYLLF